MVPKLNSAFLDNPSRRHRPSGLFNIIIIIIIPGGGPEIIDGYIAAAPYAGNNYYYSPLWRATAD